METVLIGLLEKSLQKGWKTEIWTPKKERLSSLSEKLWLSPGESFLPHGFSGGKFDSYQPILLGKSEPFLSDCIISIDGAEIGAPDIEESKRVCIVFNGLQDSELQKAREQWKSFKLSGFYVVYWSQGKGGWNNTTLDRTI